MFKTIISFELPGVSKIGKKEWFSLKNIKEYHNLKFKSYTKKKGIINPPLRRNQLKLIYQIKIRYSKK